MLLVTELLLCHQMLTLAAAAGAALTQVITHHLHCNVQMSH